MQDGCCNKMAGKVIFFNLRTQNVAISYYFTAHFDSKSVLPEFQNYTGKNI